MKTFQSTAFLALLLALQSLKALGQEASLTEQAPSSLFENYLGWSEGTQEGPRRSLEEFMSAAFENGTQLGEGNAQIALSKAREEVANSKAYPNIKAEIMGGPIPGSSGNALKSHTEWDDWDVFGRGKIELTQPLYTFGAISWAKKAALSATAGEEKLLERDRWKLRTEVAELYFGYQLAFELTELASDIDSKITKAQKKLKKTFRQSPDGIKLEQALLELRTRKLQAEKGRLQARMAMAWKIGSYGKEWPKWDQANLARMTHTLLPLQHYHELAKNNRPEWSAMEHEVKARENFLLSEKAQGLPLLFVAARGEVANAANRQNQPSSFANDPLNTINGGVVLGMKWDFPFSERNAKIAQARAESMKALAKQRHFSVAILAEVEREYLDYMEAQEKNRLLSQNGTQRKKQYQDALAGYALGSASGKAVLEKMAAYAMSEKDRLQSLYDLNLALVTLEAATGTALSKKP